MVSLALGLSLLIPAQSNAIEFKEGLAIRGVSRSGRNPVFTDFVLAIGAKNGWRAPKLGETIDAGPEKREWTKLAAREDGALPGNAFQGGYAYFEANSPKDQVMILESAGWGMVYANGEPRAGDPYGFGYVKLPVRLNEGSNSFLFASGRGNPRAKLVPPPSPVFLNLADPTFPDLVTGQTGDYLGAVTVVNATAEWQRGLRILSRLDSGESVESAIPAIPPLTFRKVPIHISLTSNLTEGSEKPLALTLAGPDRFYDFQKAMLRVRTPLQTRKITFLSQIDGSVQYYGLNPAQMPDAKALVLTLHGAGVEGIGQADAYRGKDWTHIVAPTNRRPYGFDWEEIGRLDALEVLNHARQTLGTDPLQTYLTGHSMGGHGTWTVGFHFPDLFAAIAPCAAWISFFSYGGGPRSEPKSPVEETLFRAGNASDTLLLLANSLSYPIYIHHGDKDETVSINEARAMKAQLEKIVHPSLTVHEHPGGSHWFGGESVDWPGIFDLFRSVRLKTGAEKDAVDFSAMNLAANSKAWWVEILQQATPMAKSRVQFRRMSGRLVGTTENVEALKFESDAFRGAGNPRVIEIDGQTVSIPNAVEPPSSATLVKIRGDWVPAARELNRQKSPRQTGPFKNVFRNRFYYVYGTSGTTEETAANLAKARYDAEVFGYRGNGSIEIMSDSDYLRWLEEQSKLVFIRKPDVSNIVLVGNAETNRAWHRLLPDCPLWVGRGRVRIESREWKGDDLACLFVRPHKDDDVALVGVIAATGPAGSRVLERIPYFVSGVQLPDWTLISADMLIRGTSGLRAAGFFRNDWGVAAKDLAENSTPLSSVRMN